jgi:hypothetical protein
VRGERGAAHNNIIISPSSFARVIQA